MSKMMKAALKYAERGWLVFPLKPNAKVPLIPTTRGGQGFKDATTDVEQIRKWWTEFPDANIGIATGVVSNLIVLDLDKKNDGLENFQMMLEEFDASEPDTLKV